MQVLSQIQNSRERKLAGAIGVGFLLNNMANYDPTHTTVLRNRFVSEMRKRFRELRGVIRKAVIDQDVLGLVKPETYALDIPMQRAFDFRLSSEKIDGFMGWLKTQEDKGVLEIITSPQVGGAIEEPWTNKYIQSAYKKGLQRSRAELRKAGYPVPPPVDDMFGGINAIFQGPVHSDAAGILMSRTYNELKGITAGMDQQISRVLSQGIIDGYGPATMAREMNNVIKKQGETLATEYMRAEQRAVILARTEIIHAHNEASLQEFANWEVEGVKTLVESVGAWDSRMCQKCMDLAGMDLGNGPGIFTRSQWRNYFPAHPCCRCAPVPMDVTGEKKGKELAPSRDVDSEWKSLMSRNEAEEWVKGSALEKEVYYHGTSSNLRDSIKRNGFIPGEGSRGAAYGEGVYLSKNLGIASKFSAFHKNPALIRTKVRVMKPYIVKDVDDWLSIWDKATVEGFDFRKASHVQKYFQKHGYDALDVTNYEPMGGMVIWGRKGKTVKKITSLMNASD